MVKLVRLLACLAAVGLGLAQPAFCRLTSANNDQDIWCVGPDGTEVCLDVGGQFIPTTDNDIPLGAGGKRWSALHSLDATLGDDLYVGDVAVVTGTGTIKGNAFSVGGSSFAVAGSSVGIGTLNPRAKLEILPLAFDAYHLQVSSQNGSNIASIDRKGHLEFTGGTPAISSCGGAGAAIVGNDVTGKVSVGATATDTCTLTFAAAWTNEVHCIFTNEDTGKRMYAASPSATSVVAAAESGTAIANTEFHYICVGHR